MYSFGEYVMVLIDLVGSDTISLSIIMLLRYLT